MITELEQLQNSIFSKLNLIISRLQPDSECEEYFGHSFQLNQFSIKFRKAKITPKKIGQFVTLWKRNPESKQTEPFTSEDLLIFTLSSVIKVINPDSSFSPNKFLFRKIFSLSFLKMESEVSEFIQLGIFPKINKLPKLRIGKNISLLIFQTKT